MTDPIQSEYLAKLRVLGAEESMSGSPLEAARYIDIVFDGPPGHEAGRFVEVENDKGLSISFGEWIKRPDGYWALRIPAPRALLSGEAEAGDTAETLVFQWVKRFTTDLGDTRPLYHALNALQDTIAAAITAAEARLAKYERVVEAARVCADELEDEIEARYRDTKEYPSQLRKYDLDMQAVHDVRAALRALDGDALKARKAGGET